MQSTKFHRNFGDVSVARFQPRIHAGEGRYHRLGSQAPTRLRTPFTTRSVIQRVENCRHLRSNGTREFTMCAKINMIQGYGAYSNTGIIYCSLVEETAGTCRAAKTQSSCKAPESPESPENPNGPESQMD